MTNPCEQYERDTLWYMLQKFNPQQYCKVPTYKHEVYCTHPKFRATTEISYLCKPEILTEEVRLHPIERDSEVIGRIGQCPYCDRIYYSIL